MYNSSTNTFIFFKYFYCKILLYHLFLSYISNNLSILMTGLRNNYYVVFFFVLCITMYLFPSFMYFSILFTCFFYTSIEWRVMSPCSMQVWPRFSSRVSHNNPHQLGHSRSGLYHYLFLFYFYLFFWELNQKLKVNWKFQFFYLVPNHF